MKHIILVFSLAFVVFINCCTNDVKQVDQGSSQTSSTFDWRPYVVKNSDGCYDLHDRTIAYIVSKYIHDPDKAANYLVGACLDSNKTLLKGKSTVYISGCQIQCIDTVHRKLESLYNSY
jgi:hypothetical protein